MLDVSVAYNRYQFLGNEFLTWLWFMIENERTALQEIDKELVSLEINNRMVLEKKVNENASEIITIKGDDAGMEEGYLALKKGAYVTEMNLTYASGEHKWHFNIIGESFHIGGLKTPETGRVEKKEDFEGAVLDKFYLINRPIDLIDNLFQKFIKVRITEAWGQRIVPKISGWIASKP